jgi:hypothetical protein
MEEEKPPLRFSFVLHTMPIENGKEKWNIQTVNAGIPNEIILTFVRHWLRANENNHHEFFKKEYL